MKKAILVSLHFIGRSISWRWLALISGVALMTACSGKTDKNKVSTDTAIDTERVTCYEPVAIQDSAVPGVDEQNQEDVIAHDSAQTITVPEKHTCYAWVESDL
ncbi:MAG: hypothetical protein RB294_08840 [Bacteroidales bacterium]|jgi:hypothetical protein|nr:hypothetical protein [Bacteroidales bacterium]